MTVLIAGASGALGRHVVRAAQSHGLTVRVFGRRRAALESLGASEMVVGDARRVTDAERAVTGVRAIVSVLGASVNPTLRAGYRSFLDVDAPGNTNLIRCAERAGTTRFVYVSAAGHDVLGGLRYVQAHEAVVRELERSPLEYAVLRPTGFFSAFASLLELARRGAVPLIGDPAARTNPIADEDLADRCIEALFASEARSCRTIGGPDVLSRGDIATLACQAVGKRVMIRPVPGGVVRLMSVLVRPLNPRVSDLLRFYLAVSSRDVIGEVAGTRRLTEFFASRSSAEQAHVVPPP